MPWTFYLHPGATVIALAFEICSKRIFDSCLLTTLFTREQPVCAHRCCCADQPLNILACPLTVPIATPNPSICVSVGRFPDLCRIAHRLNSFGDNDVDILRDVQKEAACELVPVDPLIRKREMSLLAVWRFCNPPNRSDILSPFALKKCGLVGGHAHSWYQVPTASANNT